MGPQEGKKSGIRLRRSASVHTINGIRFCCPDELDQFLKWQGWVATGGEASRIRDGQMQVNGQMEYRQGRQLAAGDQIDLEGETAIVPEEPQAGL